MSDKIGRSQEPEPEGREPKASVAERRARLQSIVDEIHARMAKYPSTGLKADKAFYDWLSGDD